MANTGWFGGQANFQAGQCKVEVKAVSDGSWIDESGWTDLKKSDHVTMTVATDYLDLMSMQDGSKPANAQITGQETMTEIGLAEMVAEIFEITFPGASIILDGSTVVGIAITKTLGSRLTDKLYWLRLTKYVNGQPSEELVDRVYMLVAPRIESGEWTHDLTQQFISVTFKNFPASSDYVSGGNIVLRPNSDGDDVPAHIWTMLPEEVPT